MKCIGIISVRKDKETFFKKFFKPVLYERTFGDEVKYIAVSVFAYKSKLFAAYVNRLAGKTLKKLGSEIIINTDEYNTVLKEKGIAVCKLPKSTLIPKRRLADAFEYSIKSAKDICVKECLYIIDKDCSFIDLQMLERLCMSVRSAVIITENESVANSLADKIFAGYGMIISVFDRLDKNDVPKLLIDADSRKVRIFDRTIKGAVFISESGEYNLDASVEAAFLDDENTMRIKEWI